MSKVLLVDDDGDFREALSRYLGRFGHEVCCAPDRQLALKHVLADQADFILLDVRMPVMDGLAFLKVIRSYFRFHYTPVVVLTAFDDAATLAALDPLNVRRVFRKSNLDFNAVRGEINRVA